jgi:hypothetical protein
MKARFFALLGIAVAVGANAAEPQYEWRQTNGCLALASDGRTLWQLNFKPGEDKPFFHPLGLADGTVLTAARPADHRWHLGLWWSWKYINGLNYWEEDKATGRSEGRTELVSVKPTPNADYSARVEMSLSYHPPNKPAVLTEKRVLLISAPDAKGNYSIDWDSAFTAGAEDLTFERTPPRNWAGGYAGLGLRFSPEARRWTFTSSEGTVGATNIYGNSARWVDFSDGHGVTVFDHPQNLRHPTPWYPNQNHPFICPAFLFKEPYLLAAGKTLRLRYRILMHAEPVGKEVLQKYWKDFASMLPQNK